MAAEKFTCFACNIEKPYYREPVHCHVCGGRDGKKIADWEWWNVCGCNSATGEIVSYHSCVVCQRYICHACKKSTLEELYGDGVVRCQYAANDPYPCELKYVCGQCKDRYLCNTCQKCVCAKIYRNNKKSCCACVVASVDDK